VLDVQQGDTTFFLMIPVLAKLITGSTKAGDPLVVLTANWLPGYSLPWNAIIEEYDEKKREP